MEDTPPPEGLAPPPAPPAPPVKMAPLAARLWWDALIFLSAVDAAFDGILVPQLPVKETRQLRKSVDAFGAWLIASPIEPDAADLAELRGHLREQLRQLVMQKGGGHGQ